MARSAIAVSADGSRAASVSTLTQLGETMRRGPCIYSVKWLAEGACEVILTVQQDGDQSDSDAKVSLE